MKTAFARSARAILLAPFAIGCATMATSAGAVIAEVDLADFGDPTSVATLEVGNPGDGTPFTRYSENGVTVRPANGEFGVFEADANSTGLRFFKDGGFGDGTAVLVFDEAQRFLGIEVGFGQSRQRVALFANAAGTQPIGEIILSEVELVGANEDEWFAVSSTEPFRRAEIQHVDEVGVLQNSNFISDLRFTAVPEPARAVLTLLAAGALAWLPRRRR